MFLKLAYLPKKRSEQALRLKKKKTKTKQELGGDSTPFPSLSFVANPFSFLPISLIPDQRACSRANVICVLFHLFSS